MAIKFTGSGTINGGIIDAGFTIQQVFATTLTVNPSGITTVISFSAKWFGAMGDNTADDALSLQSQLIASLRILAVVLTFYSSREV